MIANPPLLIIPLRTLGWFAKTEFYVLAGQPVCLLGLCTKVYFITLCALTVWAWRRYKPILQRCYLFTQFIATDKTPKYAYYFIRTINWTGSASLITDPPPHSFTNSSIFFIPHTGNTEFLDRCG